MEQKIRLRLNFRALIFYFMLISISLLILSGIILDNVGLSDAVRHILIGLHKVGASVFVVAAGCHVYHHWKSITKYTTRQENAFRYIKEVSIVLVIMAVVLIYTGIYIFNKHI